jgi:hypothetical protein
MRRRLLVGLAVAACALAMPLVVLGDVTVAPGGGTPGTSQNFELVGHHGLFDRGMNAALAIYDLWGARIRFSCREAVFVD